MIIYGDYFSDSSFSRLKYVYAVKEPVLIFSLKMKNYYPIFTKDQIEEGYLFATNEIYTKIRPKKHFRRVYVK